MSDKLTSARIAVIAADRADAPPASNVAPLRLLVEGAPGRYRLQPRHLPGDASTSVVRPARLGQENRSVVVKHQRPDPEGNTDSRAIEARFGREFRLLKHLSRTVPDTVRDSIPAVWDPDGASCDSSEPLEIETPIVLCVHARHAISLGAEFKSDIHGDILKEIGRVLNTMDRGAGTHNACAGCPHRPIAPSWPDDKGPPTACLESIVRRDRDGGSTPLVLTGAVLIETDMGKTTLAAWIEQGREGNLRRRTRVGFRILQRLATILREVHKAEVLHLDLNLDNICLGDGQVGLVDFGQAEWLGENAGTPSDHRWRVPWRRLDFVADELIHPRRSVRAVAMRPNERTPAVSSEGWPGDPWPSAADYLLEPAIDPHRWRPIKHPPSIQEPWGLARLDETDSYARTAIGEVDAVVHRSPRRCTDQYAFGLVALCVLFETCSPTPFRDELASFSRHLSGKAWPPFPGGKWLEYFRAFLPIGSHLLDKALEPRLTRMDKELPANDCDRYKCILLEHVKIAIQCVIRCPAWGFPAVDPFGAITARHEAAVSVLNGGSFVWAPTPLTARRYAQSFATKLPIALTDARRKSLLEAANPLRELLQSVDRYQTACRAVEEAAVSARTILARFEEDLDKAVSLSNDYINTHALVPPLLRWIGAFLDWFRSRKSDDVRPFVPPDALRTLARDVLNPRAMEQAAHAMDQSAELAAELRSLLVKPTHSDAESRRVSAIVNRIDHTLKSVKLAKFAFVEVEFRKYRRTRNSLTRLQKRVEEVAVMLENLIAEQAREATAGLSEAWENLDRVVEVERPFAKLLVNRRRSQSEAFQASLSEVAIFARTGFASNATGPDLLAEYELVRHAVVELLSRLNRLVNSANARSSQG